MEKEEELQKVQTARKEKAKADASWMKKVSAYLANPHKRMEIIFILLYFQLFTIY